MSRAKPQTHPPRRLPRLLRALRAIRAGVRRGLRLRLSRLARQPSHLLRVLGRLRTRARARRQDKTEIETP